MARVFKTGEAVRVVGGKYRGKQGLVVKCTQAYVYVQHGGAGQAKRSLRRFCVHDDPEAAGGDGRVRTVAPPLGPRLTALVRATAAVVGEAGVDVEEAVALFTEIARKAAPRGA